MISINYQSYGSDGFNLRLRFYQDGETKFICVNKILRGNLQKKHWDQKGQCFKPRAPFSKENNKTLAKFKEKYDEMAKNWIGSLDSYLLEMKHGSIKTRPDTHKFSDIIDFIVTELKKDVRSDGTVKGTFEAYLKVERRMKDFCVFSGIPYDSLCIEDFTPQLINRVFDWVQFKNENKGMHYISTTLHAVLVRCQKFGFYDMKPVEICRWSKKKKSSDFKYHTLTDEQCNKFINLDISRLPKNANNELYHDFCVFILYTCQSVCDAASLKYSDIRDIDGVPHFVFKRRKIAEKQSVSCTVPINKIMQSIMDKWKEKSKDNYIFPIRSKEKIMKTMTNNGDVKHFISRVNIWLKKVAKVIGCDFSLHTYTFRHTGITHYISAGIPVVYVSNLAGTSVDNCEKIYYNNRGDVKSRDKVLNAINF